MAAVGASTTRLVIRDEQPFRWFVTAHVPYRQAIVLREGGALLHICTEAEIDGPLGDCAGPSSDSRFCRRHMT